MHKLEKGVRSQQLGKAPEFGTRILAAIRLSYRYHKRHTAVTKSDKIEELDVQGIAARDDTTDSF